MKSIYFLPYSGITKFHELNDKLKEKLLKITKVEYFSLNKIEDYFPEKYTENFPELIFVPTIFDNENSMSYGGIDFAIRWYLHFISLNDALKFKIVLLGIEDKDSFYQNCSYSNFLKCPNVDYAQNSFEDVQRVINENNIKIFNRNEALEKIDLIGIKPPTSYKSHHSISNEWSILRWSKALNIKAELDSELKKNESNINGSLFYKYLNTKFPISPITALRKKILLNNGSVLLIDDEVEKGWGVIFQEICKGKKYRSIGRDFKKIKERDEIVKISFDIAKDFDVIILDLRLHDDDFEEKDSKKLTGYMLLKEIKKHNKGIQVIIFSATNKIWNLQELQDVGIDGFILKESPENSIDENFTSLLIENTYKTIDICLDYSFLKKSFEKYNFLKQQLEPRKDKKHSDPLPKEFVDEYLKWLEFGLSNILKYKSNLGNIMSFSIFFTVLENIANRLIDSDTTFQTAISDKFNFQFRRNNTFLKEYVLKSGSYVYNGNDLISYRNIPWTQKIINALDDLSCGFPDINYLIKKRNKIIHSNSTMNGVVKVSIGDLQKIFNIITGNLENIK